jgi:hypothetical protein
MKLSYYNDSEMQDRFDLTSFPKQPLQRFL